jgi:hypothetical protein
VSSVPIGALLSSFCWAGFSKARVGVVAVIIFRKIIKTAVVVGMITIVLGDVGFLVGGGSIINVGAGTIVNLGDGTTGNVAGISALWVVAAV